MITPEKIKEHEALCTEMISKTPDGEWKTELHRAEFKHAGLDCLLVRNFRNGNWCGYAGVKKGHPDFGKKWSELEDIDVHGGLTYSDACGGYVCHIVDNEEDLTHWFGFDCAHCYDLIPYMSADFKMLKEMHYRNFDYVKRETERLAEQLAKRAA